MELPKFFICTNNRVSRMYLMLGDESNTVVKKILWICTESSSKKFLEFEIGNITI